MIGLQLITAEISTFLLIGLTLSVHNQRHEAEIQTNVHVKGVLMLIFVSN
jgi:hypothetical protein